MFRIAHIINKNRRGTAPRVPAPAGAHKETPPAPIQENPGTFPQGTPSLGRKGGLNLPYGPDGCPPGDTLVTKNPLIARMSPGGTSPVVEPVERHDVEAVYNSAVLEARSIYSADIENQSHPGGYPLPASPAQIIKALCGAERDALLKHAVGDYPRREDYLYHHAVNVCILALYLGQELGYDRLRLDELGAAAFLHDIGIVRHLMLVNKSGAFTRDEFQAVKKHPRDALDIIAKIGIKLNQNIIDAVAQEHERLDGSGYPLGLSGGQICEYAQVIGVADVYESLTHVRPHRDNYMPLEAMKNLLAAKKGFERGILKAFIDRIGVFPVGSLVRLNTKETAMVAQNNAGAPLRPVVDILFDAQGKKLDAPKHMDLAAHSIIYVEECVEHTHRSPAVGEV